MEGGVGDGTALLGLALETVLRVRFFRLRACMRRMRRVLLKCVDVIEAVRVHSCTDVVAVQTAEEKIAVASVWICSLTTRC